MPKWIHDRAEHISAKNPSMPESEAWAIATQQSHAIGKSPKNYGTSQGRYTAKQKYNTPKDDKRMANPGKLKSPKMASASFSSFVVKVASDLGGRDFSPSQYGPPQGGSGPARQVSVLPGWNQPSLRAPLEKRALLERLVRLGATDVSHTPRLLMRHRSPEDLAALQHGVEGALKTHIEQPIMNVAEKGIKHLPSKVQGFARKGAKLIAEDPIGGTAANLIPVPGAFPAYLGMKKGLEAGIDRLAPLPKFAAPSGGFLSSFGKALTTNLGGPDLIPGVNKAIQGIQDINRNTKPLAQVASSITKTPIKPAPPVGGYSPMSPQEIMSNLAKQKKPVQPMSVTAAAFGYLKEAFQTSQYSGPLSYGGFPQVSGMPNLPAPSLRAAVRKPKAAAMMKESSMTSDLRMKQPKLTTPSVMPPTSKMPSMPKAVKGPPSLSAMPTIADVAKPKALGAKFNNMNMAGGLKMTPMPGSIQSHV